MLKKIITGLKTITGLLFLSTALFAQSSPHGSSLRFECSECHETASWKISDSAKMFNHSRTGFELAGAHRTAGCIDCHKDLVFSRTSTECRDCHNEPHQNTLGKDCAKCHTPSSWKPIDMMQKHNQFRFPLVGVHNIPDCKACHTNAGNFIYSGALADCFSCHKKDYQNTASPAHVLMGLSAQCDQCHTLRSMNWTAEKFVHVQISLKGPHSHLKCNECHTTAHTTQQCYDCHQKDFMGAKDPNHLSANFPHECLQCHNSDNWLNARFDHSATKFPLTGAHVSVSCSQCHTTGYAGTATDCYACHKNTYTATTNPSHASLGMSTDCAKCHSSQAWRPSSFSHAATGFPLSGEHARQQCSACHKGSTTGTSIDCYGCHQQDYNRAEHHVSQGYPHTCEQCHSTEKWDDAKFNHSATNFPLTGAHTSATCNQCHTSEFKGTPGDCSACHKTNFTNAVNPGHTAAGISTECVKCHNTAAWKPSTFTHSATGFTLVGAHINLQCSSCHKGTTSGAGMDCYSCHQADYNKAEGHAAQNFPHACDECHSTSTWDGAKFDHSATGFPLTGAHTAALCSQCHAGGYKGTSAQCSSCHQDKFISAVNPNHAAAGIETDCSKCHNTTAWRPSSFSHAATGFALTGAHISQQCSACHKGTTGGLNADCYSCHQADYTKAENHAAQGYPHTCEQCHSTSSWDNATFNHAATNFPLTGAHKSVSCQQCHSGGYKGTSTQCTSCHQSNYNNAANPNHAAAGISVDCSACHTTTAWIPSNFSHASTGFTLTGAHINQQCSSCHKGTTAGLNTDCYSCHQADYNRAENHASQGYPHDCAQCHTTTAWTGAAFNHSATIFPLTGAHTAVSCSQCHSSGFKGTTTVCGQCHLKNYQSTSNPNHTSLSISNTCEQCHTTNPGWKPASFPVHNNYWVLDGAHAGVASCATCHNGSYSNTPNTCYGCHKPDYDKTTNPSHASLNFSQDCQSCHTKAAWNPASYRNHDIQFFPIYSGRHSGRWSSCTTCHPNSTSYREFTCLTGNCHPQASTDREHRGRSGYSYTSAACYNCHPRGNSIGLNKARSNIQY